MYGQSFEEIVIEYCFEYHGPADTPAATLQQERMSMVVVFYLCVACMQPAL